jgi:hypothetical protein
MRYLKAYIEARPCIDDTALWPKTSGRDAVECTAPRSPHDIVVTIPAYHGNPHIRPV